MVAKSIDVSDSPDLVRLAEAVRASAEPLTLRRGDEELVIMTPVSPPGRESVQAGPKRGRRTRREITDAEIAVSRSAAGGWRGNVDPDRFRRANEESRLLSISRRVPGES